MSKIHHPIDLKSGKLQTAEGMDKRFNEQFKLIRECAKEAGLSGRIEGRIDKARRAFDAIVCYMNYFFTIYAAFVEGLRLSNNQEEFFNEVIFPLSYLRLVWRLLPKETKKKHRQLFESLEARARDAPWPEGLKEELMKKGREISETFQKIKFLRGR